MKQTVNFTDFRDAFRAHDRMENFSYEGARILFDYLEDYEEQTGEEFELDVIVLCCDFSEDTFEDIASAYNIDVSEGLEDEEKFKEIVIDYLKDNTSIIGVTETNTVVYSIF